MTYLLEINKCDSNPCENGATCENKVNAFKCKCTSNYEGKRCEIGKYSYYNL